MFTCEQPGHGLVQSQPAHLIASGIQSMIVFARTS